MNQLKSLYLYEQLNDISINTNIIKLNDDPQTVIKKLLFYLKTQDNNLILSYFMHKLPIVSTEEVHTHKEKQRNELERLNEDNNTISGGVDIDSSVAEITQAAIAYKKLNKEIKSRIASETNEVVGSNTKKHGNTIEYSMVKVLSESKQDTKFLVFYLAPRPKGENSLDNLDNNAILELLDNNQIDHKKVLQGVLYLFIKMRWLNQLVSDPNDIIHRQLNINSTPYYVIKKEYETIDKEKALCRLNMVEPNVFVSDSYEVITHIKQQSFEFEPSYDTDEYNLTGGFLEAHIKGLAAESSTGMYDNIQNLIEGRKHLVKVDAKEHKNSYIDFDIENFSSSLIVYEIYFNSLITELFRQAGVVFDNKQFAPQFKARPFIKPVSTAQERKLSILFSYSFFENWKYISKNKYKKWLERTIDKKTGEDKTAVFQDIMQKFWFNEMHYDNNTAENKKNKQDCVVISDALLRQIADKFLKAIADFFKDTYKDIDLINIEKEKGNLDDILKQVSMSDILLLQPPLSSTKATKKYWYTNDIKTKAIIEQAIGGDWWRLLGLNAYEVRGLITTLNPDKKDHLELRSFTNYLSVATLSKSESFLTDPYTQIKLKNLRDITRNKDTLSSQAWHLPSIVDLVNGLLEQNEDWIIDFDNRIKNILKKIKNELMIKNLISHKAPVELILPLDSPLNFSGLDGVYKGYFINRPKTKGSKQSNAFFASEIQFKVEDSALKVVATQLFTTEKELRKNQPLFEAVVKIYDNSFYMVSPDQQEILTVYHSSRVGRTLVSGSNEAFLNWIRDDLEDSRAPSKKNDSESVSRFLKRGRNTLISNYFPLLYPDNPNNSLKQKKSTEWIYFEDNGVEGIKTIITSPSAPSAKLDTATLIYNLIVMNNQGELQAASNTKIAQLYFMLSTYDVVLLNDFSDTSLVEKMCKTIINN